MIKYHSTGCKIYRVFLSPLGSTEYTSEIGGPALCALIAIAESSTELSYEESQNDKDN